MTQQLAPERLTRIMTVSLVVLNACWPLLTLSSMLLGPRAVPSSAAYRTVAVVGVACYLCLQLPVVLAAAHGIRPRHLGRRLAAAATVALGVALVIGPAGFGLLSSLAALLLIALRPPWSLYLFAGAVAVPVPLSLAAGDPVSAPYYALGALLGGVSLAAIAWPIPAMRRLQAARIRLAQEAVLRERLRIDQEVRLTVGRDLETIAAAGDRADALLAADPAAAVAELRRMVGRSRGTLLRVRRMLSRYQEVSPRAELETAARLLSAAGVEVELVLPPDEELRDAEVGGRAELRRELSVLLAQGTVRSCRIAVVPRAAGWQLQLSDLRFDPAPRAERSGA